MKKPLDIEYIKKYFKDFYTQIVESNFLKKDDKSLHAHNNKSTIDKLTESDSGKLLFNDKEIIETSVIDSKISIHNTSDTCHVDLRDLIKDVSIRLNALADSDDETLDQLSEIVSYIKNNKDLIDGVTTSKISISDIINNIDVLNENTTSGKVVDALVIKNIFDSIGNGESAYQIAVKNGFVGTEQEWLESLKGEPGEDGNVDNISPETIGAATKDHIHGHMKTITLSTIEPTTVAEGEIVMVYEDSPPIIQTKTLTGITVTSPPKTEYIKNETFDISGIVVIAHYDTDETADVTSNATFNPSNGAVLETIGENIVTVTYTEGEVTKTISVTITVSEQSSSLKIVTWSDGTDEEIVNMLNAHYKGDINIHDYWHVGDERIIHLNAMDAEYVDEPHEEQDITMVLMNAGGKTLETSINGEDQCAFIVGQKDVLNNFGNISSTPLNDDNLWTTCDRRNWCNNTYFKSLPNYFSTIFKPYRNYLDGDNYIIDTFSLPAEYELCGSRSCAIYDESKNLLFDYYKTPMNLKKYQSNNLSPYWLRTQGKYSSSFCLVGLDVNNNTRLMSYDMTYKTGIAPFGCI